MPRQLPLSAPTLEELRRKVLAEHGPDARIVKAEKVSVGGLGGFLARTHYEGLVELPSAGPTTDPLPIVSRTGIAALLADADTAETRIAGSQTADMSGASTLSTRTGDFADLLHDLSESVEEPVPAPEKTKVPAVPASPGDLIVIAGLGTSALEAARGLAAKTPGTEVRVAGDLDVEGPHRIEGRNGAFTARAEGVEYGMGIIVAYGLGAGLNVGTHLSALKSLKADAVWLAVDVTRKTEDTAAWTSAVAAQVPVDAISVSGTGQTRSPDTARSLGFPVGWTDAPVMPASPPFPAAAQLTF